MKNFRQIYKEANNKITGIPAAPGIVIGEVYLFSKETLQINGSKITDVDDALKNFNDALKKSKKELNKVLSIAKEKMEDERAAIFEAQIMVLDDPYLIQTIKTRIDIELRQPEYIVNDEICKYLDVMRRSNVSLMKERANDIEDIKNRIIRNLQKKRWESKISENMIVVSESITPADALLFSRRNVRGFVTDHGGHTSHAAIISRSLNIPAVVGTHKSSTIIKDGDTIIVDGFHGFVLYKPTEEQLSFFRAKEAKLKEIEKSYKELKDLPAATKDNKSIVLLANVDVTGEIDLVITNGAKGIGLYRTEQIMEETGEFPSEEEQFLIYNRLAERVYPRTITIRAFDIGGDKVKFIDFKEPNPFLGMRGVRVLLENQTLLRGQFKAVLRASRSKNVQFMLPLVTTIAEIKEAKKIFEECKNELKKDGIEYDKHIKIGIMIEVPSAAIMAYEMAEECDFISIGTNDLIQFIMAVDRGNDLVSNLYQEFHPSVIRTVYHIVRGAKRAGKIVSICGEMAADTLAIPLLIGMDLDSLSMSPTTIPYAKRIIRSCEFKSAKKLTEECLECRTQDEVVHLLQKFFKDNNITRTRNIL